MFINAYLKYIIWWVDRGLEHEKHLVRHHLYRFILKTFAGDLN